MELLRAIDVDAGGPHRAGRIALYRGDLSALPPEHAVDLLLLSAFHNDYNRTRRSVITSLEDRGLSLEILSERRAADLRGSAGFWLTAPLDGNAAKFNIGRILCFEHQEIGTPAEAVGLMFRGLFPFIEPDGGTRIATSVLATGNQGFPADEMLTAMLTAASEWMARGLEIAELKIVEIVPEKAEALARVFDGFVERNRAAGEITRGEDYTDRVPGLTPDLALQRRDAHTALLSRAPQPRPEPPPAPRPKEGARKGDADPWSEFKDLLTRTFGIGQETPAPPPPERGEPEGAYDVFLSFTSADKADATRLVEAIRGASGGRLRIFDYRIEIDKAAFWQAEIDRAIKDCRLIVALMSPEYFDSAHCVEELMIARLLNKDRGGGLLHPVYWRRIEEGLEPWLRIINYTDCREADAAKLSAAAVSIANQALAS